LIDYCLTTNKQFSAISWQELHFDEITLMSDLYWIDKLSWFC